MKVCGNMFSNKHERAFYNGLTVALMIFAGLNNQPVMVYVLACIWILFREISDLRESRVVSVSEPITIENPIEYNFSEMNK